MFIKCTGNRPGDASVGYYKIVESYRDKNNRIKHRILLNLGPLPHVKADQLKGVLEAYRNPDFVSTSLEDILVISHKRYLDVMVLYHYCQLWGLDQLFNEFIYVVPLIINRCLDPESKIGVTRWVKKTVLPELLATSYDQIDSYLIYRECDCLNKLEEKIQKHIYNQLIKNYTSSVFFYDITSTYFEGVTCTLCRFGYSRDNRPDRKQINIALLIDDRGYPFYWKVLPGNTQDVTTITELVKTLKARFSLSDCTVIFDRGMVSDDNLNRLRAGGMSFVTALDRDQISGLELFELSLFEKLDLNKPLTQQLPGYKRFDQKLYYQEKKIGKTRYILGFNPLMRQDEITTLQENITRLMDYFDQKNIDLSKAKKSRNESVLNNQIESKLKKKKLHKVIDYELLPKTSKVQRKDGTLRTVNTFKIAAEINSDKYLKASSLYGLSCFITELDENELRTEKVLSAYRAKYSIEKTFRIIKNTIKLRPVYLTREERVKAHVTICVLAYLLMVSMDNTLKQSNIQLEESVDKLLEEFSECRVNTIKIRGQNKLTKNITELTDGQKVKLKAIGCGYLIKKKYYKKIITEKE